MNWVNLIFFMKKSRSNFSHNICQSKYDGGGGGDR